ncbi:Pescadillo N-terminus-domain-containing protein [Pelagophyceae sp. CCMP2097]|nr:Pescadillo N-terminus-domain-containing protein [Pelagophyceae sp. CCMP2097]
MGTNAKAKKGGSVRKVTSAKTGTSARLQKMGKRSVKGQSGIVTAFISRTTALRRLQLTLKDFRRLCILKGVYPRDPKKSQDKSKTYYHVKDIQHLSHEPLLDKFREFKGFMKKVRRHIGRRDVPEARRKFEALPKYTLHHLVKERYPRFADAVGDLDDPLCTVFLFAALPAQGRVVAEKTHSCVDLAEQWMALVAQQRTLRRAFISIKGVYLEADVGGQRVTWLVPHKFTPFVPTEVDFRVMLTFLEFYETMVKFVLYKLYRGASLAYPPRADVVDHPATFAAWAREASGAAPPAAAAALKLARASAAAAPTMAISKELQQKLTSAAAADGADDDADDSPAPPPEANDGSVFAGLKFFLHREAIHPWLEFVIVSGGGECGWALEGSPVLEGDATITHRIVDKASAPVGAAGAEVVQPQWVVDSFNAGMLLPVARYAPGAALPPHLSPFVDDGAEGYVPEYREQIDQLRSASQVFKSSKLGASAISQLQAADDEAEEAEDADEADDDDDDMEEDDDGAVAGDEEKLEHIMMGKKAKRLYGRMQRGLERKKELADRLRSRRK